jgi:DNA recombination protein RmuC
MQIVVALLLGGALGGLCVWLLMRERLASERTRTRFAQEGREQLAESFRALSAEALRESNDSFLQLARTQLEGMQSAAREELESRKQAVASLVTPIKESLERVDRSVGELERNRRQDYGALGSQLQILRAETSQLVTALRAPAVRGRWGEMQLRRAVETAGMLAYCDFVEQVTVNADDRSLRPDLVVRLPGGRNVVVDAKTPLQALLDAAEALDENERAARLQDYARHVREHMTKLGGKAYWQQFSPTPDFVLMFLPGESFFRTALEQDPSLLEHSAGERVILASPTSLITLLRAVAVGWREETVTESARQVSELGRELYERLAVMASHFADLGKKLDGAVSAYNQTVGSLERRVLVSARRFTEHGVEPTRDLPLPEPVEQATRPPQTIELTPRIGDSEADAA